MTHEDTFTKIKETSKLRTKTITVWSFSEDVLCGTVVCWSVIILLWLLITLQILSGAQTDTLYRYSVRSLQKTSFFLIYCPTKNVWYNKPVIVQVFLPFEYIQTKLQQQWCWIYMSKCQTMNCLYFCVKPFPVLSDSQFHNLAGPMSCADSLGVTVPAGMLRNITALSDRFLPPSVLLEETRHYLL